MRRVASARPPPPPTWRLFFAIGQGDLAKATAAIDDGADVNHVDEPKVENPFAASPEDLYARAFDWRGLTPLTFAIEHARLDFIRLLVERGARIDLRDRWGRLPLEAARSRLTYKDPAPGLFELLHSLGALDPST